MRFRAINQNVNFPWIIEKSSLDTTQRNTNAICTPFFSGVVCLTYLSSRLVGQFRSFVVYFQIFSNLKMFLSSSVLGLPFALWLSPAARQLPLPLDGLKARIQAPLRPSKTAILIEFSCHFSSPKVFLRCTMSVPVHLHTTLTPPCAASRIVGSSLAVEAKKARALNSLTSSPRYPSVHRQPRQWRQQPEEWSCCCQASEYHGSATDATTVTLLAAQSRPPPAALHGGCHH